MSSSNPDQTPPPGSPSNRSAHAGCVIRVSIDGLGDKKSGAGALVLSTEGFGKNVTKKKHF